MAMKRVFFNNIRSCKYHFKNGKEANFVNGQYLTDIEEEIKELEAEIAARHPHIFVKNEMMQVDDAISPIQALREKIAAEERAKIMAEMGSPVGGAPEAPAAIQGAADKIAAVKAQLGGIATSKTVSGLSADSNGK